MFLYSLKNKYELEKTFQEDKNQFLSDFLMETSVDYESTVSIRSTVVDFLDEAFQHSEFSNQTYLNTIEMLSTNSFDRGQGPQVLQKIRALNSITDINCETDIFAAATDFTNIELSLFLLGSPLSEALIKQEHIEYCLSLLTQEVEPNVIVKLRALWFFEKMASHENIMKKKNAEGVTMLRRVFEIVGEKFA